MNINDKLFKWQFNKKKQVRLLVQINNLVEAGVPAPDALRHMRDNFHQKKNTLFFTVVDQMCENAAQGKKITEDMEDWFPYEVCKIITTTEERGILSEGLKSSINYLESNQVFFAPLSKMTGGITYVIALLIAIALIGHIYLPKIGQYVKVWPEMSKIFYDFSSFLYSDFPFIIIFIIAIFAWALWSIRNYSGSFYQIIALPFLRIYKAKIGYAILKSLALLSENGVGIPEIVYQLSYQYKKGMVADKLELMHERIRAGEQNMGEAMDTGLFTNEQISELNLISRFVGEEKYSEIFHVMSNIISKQIIESLTRIAVVANMICLVLTGAGILWIYGSYAILASSIQ